ncbi:T9SS type A sorting domain-containing protein [Flavivirga eckloniae]|nr:T9SS type A sorting domain-containing protein [Flavivirga eckloniae]
MKKNSLLLFTVLIVNHSLLIAQKISVQNTHTVNFDATTVVTETYFRSDFVLDHDGNKIIVGGFDGENVAFDVSNQISSDNNKNIFIAKYDRNNTILWIKNIGGKEIEQDFGSPNTIANDVITSVKIDTNNNIYVLGTANLNSKDIVDFDPEHTNTNSILNTGFDLQEEIIFAKYAPDGTLLWLKIIGDSDTDNSLKMVLDKNNDIWITGTMIGFTTNNIDFDREHIHPNGEDILPGQFFHLGFIAHYNNNGDFISVKGIGNGFFSDINIQIGATGNIYIAGSFNGKNTELFLEDTNPLLITSDGSYEWSPQNEDIFLMKCSSTGAIQWVKTIGNPLYSRASGFVIDANENIYVTGFFNGNMDFDIDHNHSFDIKTSTSKGSGFVAKYDTNGKLKWLNTISGGISSRSRTIKLRGGYLVFSGDYKGSNVQFGDKAYSSGTNSNAFISILKTNGNWVATKVFPSTDYSSITNIALSSNGAIHFLGFNADLYSGYIDATKMFFGESNTVLSAADTGNTSNKISTYPNPTERYININNTGLEKIETLELYSITGQLIWSKAYNQEKSIDIRDQSQGIYILKIITQNNQSQIVKLTRK